MVRRGPRLNDRLRRFLRHRARQHPLATGRAFLLRRQRNRILSLHYNELGREPPHRSDLPLTYGSHHPSWGFRVLCLVMSPGVYFLFILFPGDGRLDARGGAVSV